MSGTICSSERGGAFLSKRTPTRIQEGSLRTIVIISRKYPPPDRAFRNRGKTTNVFISVPAMPS
jgi:hypothetical protein